MTVVWLGTALWAVWIINDVCHRFADWLHREPTETDRYCSSVDAELDELAAKRATRPHTNGCEIIPFPAHGRSRTRGDVA